MTGMLRNGNFDVLPLALKKPGGVSGTKVVTHFSTPPAVCHVVLFVVPRSTQKVHLRWSQGSEKWIFSILLISCRGKRQSVERTSQLSIQKSINAKKQAESDPGRKPIQKPAGIRSRAKIYTKMCKNLTPGENLCEKQASI